jgi:prepilin-type N-terminal cleavage/methylation domain-containing protein
LNRARQGRAGVTLVEMMVVVTIIGLIGAISFPAVSSGLDSIRLSSASNSIVSLLNSALNRAERRQVPVEITISITQNNVTVRGDQTASSRILEMPEGVKIIAIHPLRQDQEETARSVVVYPGGTVPPIGLEVENRRGMRRIVRVDPITGVPQVEQVAEERK